VKRVIDGIFQKLNLGVKNENGLFDFQTYLVMLFCELLIFLGVLLACASCTQADNLHRHIQHFKSCDFIIQIFGGNKR
jgi:hypothetical protein